MVSNDTQSLQPGQGCYTTFLNAKGHLIADFVVYAEADAYLLELSRRCAPFYRSDRIFRDLRRRHVSR